MLNLIRIAGDLTVRIGDSAVRLSPREGLRIAEDLARKSFRRVLAEEAGVESVKEPRPIKPTRGRAGN